MELANGKSSPKGTRTNILKKVQADCGQFLITVLGSASTNERITASVGNDVTYTYNLGHFFYYGSTFTCNDSLRMDVTDDQGNALSYMSFTKAVSFPLFDLTISNMENSDWFGVP